MRTYVSEKRTAIPVRRFDPVEAEAERQWEKREQDFQRIYPNYHFVPWGDATDKARKLMLEKAKRDLLQKGVAV